MSSRRVALLALTSVVAGCNPDERAKQTIDAALEVEREDARSTATTDGGPWTGEPLPVTEFGRDRWTVLEIPTEPMGGTRLADTWLLRAPDHATSTYSDARLTLWRASFRVVELGADSPRTLFESEDGVRTVGMGLIGEHLVVGVQHRDASTGASVAARADAIAELERGNGETASALAGPAGSHLLEIDLATGETRTEPFPQQRMQSLAVGPWRVWYRIERGAV